MLTSLGSLGSLASLILPKAAPLKDQHDTLPRLKEAHAAAQAAVRDAQEAFDIEGTPATQKALAKAQEAEQEAASYVARAERNLAAAETARAAAERQTKERRAKELRAQIADSRVTAQLVQAEVEAWIGVVRARLARVGHHGERHEMQRQLLGLEIFLNGNAAGERFRFDDNMPSVYPVAAELQGHAHRELDPKRREILNGLVSLLAPGGVR
jgi:hypothetical protein